MSGDKKDVRKNNEVKHSYWVSITVGALIGEQLASYPLANETQHSTHPGQESMQVDGDGYPKGSSSKRRLMALNVPIFCFI